MHLLFLDESGIQRGSPSLVVAGLSLHEVHVGEVARQVDALVESHLAGTGLDPGELELHASEMRHPQPGSKKPGKGRKKISAWVGVPQQMRMALLGDAYSVLAKLRCGGASHGCGLFGVVMDAAFHQDDLQHVREQLAYEHLLVKFDDSLRRAEQFTRGLVIHDRRVVAERDIQAWTQDWQEAAGRLKLIEHLAMLPLFADSRGTRLLQLADLVCWALQRYYIHQDERWIKELWSQFDFVEGHMHGLIHLQRAWQSCPCVPCSRRHDRDLSPLTP